MMVLPSALLHEIRGEEGRFALAARDMLEHGRWLLPEVLHEPYINKPPLLLWLIAGAMWLTGGEAVWTIRLPTIAGMFAAAWLVAATVRRSAGTVPSILAVLALFSMPMIIELPAQAETDRLLVPLVFAAALLWFAGLGRPERSRLRVTCWAGCAAMLALAALTKGPMPVVMVFVAAGTHAVIVRRPAQVSTLIAVFALAMVPLGLWTWAAYEPGYAELWQAQMKLGSGGSASGYLNNMARYGGDVFVLLLPWLLIAAAVVRRPVRNAVVGLDPFSAFVMLLAAACLLLPAVWPDASARYAMPGLPALVFLAVLVLHNWRVEAWWPWPALAGGVIVILVVQMAIVSGARRHAERVGTEARELAELVSARPAPIWLIADTVEHDVHAHNTAFLLPSPLTRLRRAGELPEVSGPVWIIATSAGLEVIGQRFPAARLEIRPKPMLLGSGAYFAAHLDCSPCR